VLGRQLGTIKPGEYPGRRDGVTRYRHDPESFQKMWDVIGEKTGTKWRVDAQLLDARRWLKVEPTAEQSEERNNVRGMQFAVHRVD